MSAIKFIKENGVDKARGVVGGAPDKTASHYVISKRPHYYSVDFQSYFNNGDWHDSDYTSEQDLANDYEPQNVIRISDLKRLVESIELIEKLGGIESAKSYVPDQYKSERLKQAIADYEAIYTNDIKIEVSFGVSLMSPERVACINLTSVSPTSDTIDDSDLEYHVIKNCKVIDYD